MPQAPARRPWRWTLTCCRANVAYIVSVINIDRDGGAGRPPRSDGKAGGGMSQQTRARDTAAPWTEADVPDQSGRTAVITGGNSGIGFEAARVLAERGALLFLGCRDQGKAH